MPPFYTPSGGTLSPYLIGSFDLRIAVPGNPPKHRQTIIQLINPTPEVCIAVVALFDPGGHLQRRGRPIQVPMNGLVEISIGEMEPMAPFYGVLKVACIRASGLPTIPPGWVPSLGLVGVQRQFFGGESFSESPLQPVPVEILVANNSKELQLITGG